MGCQMMDPGRYARGYESICDALYIRTLNADSGSAAVWTDHGACNYDHVHFVCILDADEFGSQMKIALFVPRSRFTAC